MRTLFFGVPFNAGAPVGGGAGVTKSLSFSKREYRKMGEKVDEEVLCQVKTGQKIYFALLIFNSRPSLTERKLHRRKSKVRLLGFPRQSADTKMLGALQYFFRSSVFGLLRKNLLRGINRNHSYFGHFSVGDIGTCADGE